MVNEILQWLCIVISFLFSLFCALVVFTYARADEKGFVTWCKNHLYNYHNVGKGNEENG